jgi:branched-chain amino acid transport system permease protein
MNLWYTAHEVVIQQTLIYLLLALSFQVVLRAGVSSFVSIGFYGLGGYTAANLAEHGLPLAVTLLIVVVAAAAVGFGLSWPLARLNGLYLGMATFALDQIVVVFGTNGGSFTGGAVGLYGIPIQVATGTLAIIAVVVLVAMSQLERSAIGRAFAVHRADVSLTRAMGIDVRQLRSFASAISAALGAAAGALSVLTFSVFSAESFGFDLLVTALTMAVVGGVQSWRGALIGAILVTWFPTVFTVADGVVQQIVYGVLVVLVMTFEPDGIIGLVRRLVMAVRRRHSAQQQLPDDSDPAAAAPSADRTDEPDDVRRQPV